MTGFFGKKRLSKTFIILLLLVVMLAIMIFYRRPIAIKSIEHFTQSQDIHISCLDFTVDWQLNVDIQKACARSPLGSIEVTSAKWQPWSNLLNIKLIKVEHTQQLAADNNVEEQPASEQQPIELNLPDYLPQLTISHVKFDSFALLHPINISVSQNSNKELRITGDLNAIFNVYQKPMLAQIDWRLSDLTKWVPQAQQLSQDNAKVFSELALDKTQVKTRLSFDGKILNLVNQLDIDSRINIENCALDAVVHGDLLIDVDLSSFDIGVDLRQLSNSVSMDDCSLLQDYFTADTVPQLAIIFPQKATIHKNQISLPKLQVVDKQNANRSIVVNDLNYKTTGEIALQGKINSADLQIAGVSLANINSAFSVSGASVNDVQVRLDSQFSQLALTDVSLQNMSHHLDLHIKELNTVSFSGNSSITDLALQNISLLPIVVAHTGQASLLDMTLSSQHKVELEQSFMLELQQQQAKTTLHINNQDISRLQSIITQFENALTLKYGSFSASIEFTLPQENQPFSAQGTADLQDVSIKYQDYLLNNMTYQTPLTFDSAGLQLPESTLRITSIDAGVMIKQLEAKVISQNSVLRLKQAQGNIFNGQFLLGDIWLDGREQQFNINIQDLDLAQVVALQEQPGIQITGNIDGDMPFIMNEQGIRIEDGWVSSLTGGKLTIANNPSFDSIKEQQPQLALLENLDFSQLKSKVTLSPDGEMLFNFAINGNNPLQNQSVNFNYSHQENIFSLLESIRLVKAVENKIEQKITQGDKK